MFNSSHLWHRCERSQKSSRICRVREANFSGWQLNAFVETPAMRRGFRPALLLRELLVLFRWDRKPLEMTKLDHALKGARGSLKNAICIWKEGKVLYQYEETDVSVKQLVEATISYLAQEATIHVLHLLIQLLQCFSYFYVSLAQLSNCLERGALSLFLSWPSSAPF